MLYEAFESRRLFAVTASVIGGELIVRGDDAANTIYVGTSGSNLVVKRSSSVLVAPLLTVPSNSVSKIFIVGLGGNDTLSVNVNVTKPSNLSGGDGNDIVRGGSGADTLDGGIGNDTLYGNGGDDYLMGAARGWNNTLYGGSGDDWLRGGYGNNTMYGESGNDRLDSHGGVQIMYGGAGSDVFFSNDGDWNDLIYGGDPGNTTGTDGRDVAYIDRTNFGSSSISDLTIGIESVVPYGSRY